MDYVCFSITLYGDLPQPPYRLIPSKQRYRIINHCICGGHHQQAYSSTAQCGTTTGTQPYEDNFI